MDIFECPLFYLPKALSQQLSETWKAEASAGLVAKISNHLVRKGSGHWSPLSLEVSLRSDKY